MVYKLQQVQGVIKNKSMSINHLAYGRLGGIYETNFGETMRMFVFGVFVDLRSILD